MKKQFAPLIIFAVLVLFLAIGLTLNPQNVPSPLIGKTAPQFELPQLNSAERFSPQQLQGKAWILNIWASWCSSCKQEHKLLVDLAKTQPYVIVGLNYKDTAAEANSWLQRYSDPYSVVIEDAQGKAGIDWGVYGVPETFVIDTHGIIRHKFTGPLTRQSIEETLIPLMQTLQSEVQS
ncbi:DsbE family thiol:disulfide interchange protein [Thiomicrorhabdus heinhorstiae]|uniref:DsbE family thiol:disulfide interchange protein n=1 Tax=Thiomicrorhabdus heinhorstiae TaxID=2748010 RepID=A0ABS0BXT0_9GAMM|nr:DsbE family thiol:disulfide interchange protein [Thiomicrorhabdus heinhorstiae]MBF6058209.1 DsbE family thiol:disulfide interchange protein [Thiomicrorhabdus heinhorstiae]